ncbi:MAG: hypothetical protein ACRD1E_09235 [Terriglobales bacterium]
MAEWVLGLGAGLRASGIGLEWQPGSEAGQLVEAPGESLESIVAGLRHKCGTGCTVRLWAWMANGGVRLQLRRLDPPWEGSLCAEWLVRRCVPATGAARRGRGRLGAQAGPHARLGAQASICVLSANAGLIEHGRALAAQAPANGLWHTPAPRRALQWLMSHPRCPAFVVEHGSLIVLADPALGTAIAVPMPPDSTRMVEAAGKIYREREFFLARNLYLPPFDGERLQLLRRLVWQPACTSFSRRSGAT